MFTLKRKDRFHTDDFPIAVERRDPQEHFELEAHDSYAIVIVVGGRAFHVTRLNSRPLGAGDVLIVRASEAREYCEIKNLHLINILFRPNKLHMELLDLSGVPGYQVLFSFEPSGRKRDSQRRSLQLSSKELSVALNYVETLDHELKMRNPGFAFMACAWFMQHNEVSTLAVAPTKAPQVSEANAIADADLQSAPICGFIVCPIEE